MNCQDVDKEEVLERYLLGRILDEERDNFERHYFGCDSCFATLQMGLAMQLDLEKNPPLRYRAKGVSWHQLLTWTAAVAALLVVVVGGMWWYAGRSESSNLQPSTIKVAQNPTHTSPSAQAPNLEELAKVEAPPYAPIVVRGTEDAAHEKFRRAMQFYSNADYTRAIPGLRAAAKASPDVPGFAFYLGASYLRTGQVDPAIQFFRKTILLAVPEYSEPSRFYLAKAYLQKKDVSAAEEQLRIIVQMHGSKAAEAQALLDLLGKQSSRP